MCGRLSYSWDIGVMLPGLVLLLDDKTGVVPLVHGSLLSALSPLPTHEACLRVLSTALNTVFSSLFLSD